MTLAHEQAEELALSERPTINPARIDPASVPAQRAAGWPNFHPEAFCHRCGDRNINWFADTEAWAAITTAYLGASSHAGIVCPACASELHEAATGETTIWELRPWAPESQDPSTTGEQNTDD